MLFDLFERPFYRWDSLLFLPPSSPTRYPQRAAQEQSTDACQSPSPWLVGHKSPCNDNCTGKAQEQCYLGLSHIPAHHSDVCLCICGGFWINLSHFRPALFLGDYGGRTKELRTFNIRKQLYSRSLIVEWNDTHAQLFGWAGALRSSSFRPSLQCPASGHIPTTCYRLLP